MPQLPPGLRNNVLSLRYLLLGFLLSWLPLPASGLAAIPLALSLFYGIRYLRDVRRAGVVVSAAGSPGIITPEMVAPGAVVLDVGVSRVVDPATGKGRIAGDVADGVDEAGYDGDDGAHESIGAGDENAARSPDGSGE